MQAASVQVDPCLCRSSWVHQSLALAAGSWNHLLLCLHGVNSFGGQVPHLLQGLDDTGLFQQPLGQNFLPPQVPQTSTAGTALPFQTSSGVPNVMIGSAGSKQRQAGFSTPGFADVASVASEPPVGQRMPPTVVTPTQMQMQVHSGDGSSINTGLPEAPGLPVVPDATVLSESSPSLPSNGAGFWGTVGHFLTYSSECNSNLRTGR